jgi:hypothetical protein
VLWKVLQHDATPCTKQDSASVDAQRVVLSQKVRVNSQSFVRRLRNRLDLDRRPHKL